MASCAGSRSAGTSSCDPTRVTCSASCARSDGEAMTRFAPRTIRGAGALIAVLLIAGCSAFGPKTLARDRLRYNEVVKSTTEEQLLLNIVRLRYSDTPSSLAVSAIAA